MLEFVKLEKKHLQLVLDWRTRPDITRYMVTDIEYDMEKHIQWYEQISNNRTCRYWIISYKDNPVGLVSLKKIDWKHKHCYGGYYIGEQNYRNRLGGLVPLCLLNYIFSTLYLHKHIAEILSENKQSIAMHRSIGYKEVGTLKDHVNKNDQWKDMIILEFISSNWEKLKSKYSKYMVDFA